MAGSVVSPTGPRTAAVTPAWLYSCDAEGRVVTVEVYERPRAVWMGPCLRGRSGPVHGC